MLQTRHSLLVLTLLAAACGKEKQASPAQPIAQAADTAEPKEEQSEREKMFALAGPKCTELVKHLFSIAEASGETTDDLDDAIRFQLAFCMTAEFTAEETQCMKAATTPDGYLGCTAARLEASQAATKQARNPQAIDWITNVDLGLAAAAQKNKPVVLQFVASWCVPCKTFETHVLGDARVASLIKERFVPVRLDVSQGTAGDVKAQERFDAATLPAILLLDPTGKELKRVQGLSMPNADEFLATLSALE